ncbi:hypothetical protein E3P99_00803 [Wallemia hederae]|uniref:Ras modification protein ERF4 n=1 Tax=Wallemia hederae TaxID=1540922 RepID=A0A4T0FTB6_9BASI|nr:hypothetical protein E3P99_00803 [Wallemia hederae]
MAHTHFPINDADDTDGQSISTHSHAQIYTTHALKNFGTTQERRVCIDLPREIVRIDRDYQHGEVWQFKKSFPMELEGRINAEQFAFAVHEINLQLQRAFNPTRAVVDYLLDVATLYTLSWFKSTHFESQLKQLDNILNYLNYNLFNPAGLNLLSPATIGFLYLEIEYY